MTSPFVIPAKAGIHLSAPRLRPAWHLSRDRSASFASCTPVDPGVRRDDSKSGLRFEGTGR